VGVTLLISLFLTLRGEKQDLEYAKEIAEDEDDFP